MKKIEVTKEQMVEAVKANGKEPWGVLGIKLRTWFDIIKRAGLTMFALKGANVSADSANVSTRTIRPVPQWEPNVPNEANSVGRGGVRYRYTDTEKYNEFKKEDAFRIMELEAKSEITHKPAEREIKPEIPEELLQYDQTDVPYEVWNKYIDDAKFIIENNL